MRQPNHDQKVRRVQSISLRGQMRANSRTSASTLAKPCIPGLKVGAAPANAAATRKVLGPSAAYQILLRTSRVHLALRGRKAEGGALIFRLVHRGSDPAVQTHFIAELGGMRQGRQPHITALPEPPKQTWLTLTACTSRVTVPSAAWRARWFLIMATNISCERRIICS